MRGAVRATRATRIVKTESLRSIRGPIVSIVLELSEVTS